MATVVKFVDRWRCLRERAYKRQDPSIGYPLARWWARPWALPISAILAKGAVSPHAITLLSLLLGLAAVVAFALAPFPRSLLLGTAFLFLWYLTDHVDGQVARLTGRTSVAGAYFDFYMHGLVHLAGAWAIARCAQGAAAKLADAAVGAPLLFFLGQVALEAHGLAEARTTVKSGLAVRCGAEHPRPRPWRWLFRLCEFPNILPQLAVLAAFSAVTVTAGALTLRLWATGSGLLALTLAAARLVRRVRSPGPERENYANSPGRPMTRCV